ncbi:MAG: acyltransferase [Chloroflexi bacterium]|nr:acyltransferase [Chloroflexota bacterium]
MQHAFIAPDFAALVQRLDRFAWRGTGANAGSSYVPGLDGLRALAVVAVLLYHASPDLVPGGFLGVEVFFVLSGYLITSLLLAEWQTRQYINLRGFWLRRVRRLLPAVLAVLVATLAFAALFLPDELAEMRPQALAALAYVSNWQQILQQTSYFESVGRPPLLRHLWSLAVEEQFYLVWPPLLFLGLRLGRGNPRPLVATVLGTAIGSCLLMALLYQPDTDPSRVYYGTDTRASGPLLGAALALVWRPGASWHTRFPRAVELAGLLALVALGVAALRLSEFDPRLYRGGFLVVDLATLLIIAAIALPGGRLAATALAWPPLIWIGLRSYSIYLWHWPIFDLTRPQLDVPLDGLPLTLVRLALTVLLAELSFRVVEGPVRRGALGRAWHTWRGARGAQRRALGLRWAGLATVGVACMALLGTSVAAARPPETPGYLATESVDTWVDSRAPARMSALQAATAAPANASPAPTATPVAASAAPPTPAAPTTSTPTGDASTPPPAAAAPPTADTAPTDGPTTTDASSAVPTQEPAPDAASAEPPTLGTVDAIGDSVMLGAVTALQQTFGDIQIDAAESRQVAVGIQRLQARRDEGALGDTVIVHLGNNGTFTDQQFDALMAILGDVPRVAFVNDKVPRVWEGPNDAVIAAGVQRYSNTILVDWREASGSQPSFFWNDGIHLRPAGAQAYADLLDQVLTSSETSATPQ